MSEVINDRRVSDILYAGFEAIGPASNGTYPALRRETAGLWLSSLDNKRIGQVIDADLHERYVEQARVLARLVKLAAGVL